jgi:hypothetical protein
MQRQPPWSRKPQKRFTNRAPDSTIVFPTFVSAADWKQLSVPSAYVDAASIRTDYFSTQEGAVFAMRPYIVVWLKFTIEDGDILLETVFNCQGGFEFEVMQQIVANDAPNSQHHSFDNTQALRRINREVQVKSIAPESAYEVAQNLVCK